MSLMRGQSSAIESFIESNEFSFNSQSPNNAYQNISLSQSSDQSSTCSPIQNQINDLGARNDHGLHSSFNKEQNHVENNCNGVRISPGNLISDDDTSNQGPNFSPGHAEDDSHSVGAPDISGQQEDISLGSNFTISGLSDKRREVQGGLRQTFEAGSSSGPQQAEHNLSNNISAHLHVSSSHTISTSPSSLAHVNSIASLHPSTSIFPERPHGNLNPLLFNSHGVGNSPMHFDLNPGQSLFQMWLNDVSVGSNAPNMSRMAFVPGGSRYLPQSNLRAGPSNHQMEFNSGFHQWPPFPSVYPSSNQAGSQQTLVGYLPWFPSPWNGYGSGAWNFDVSPRPYPTTYGHMTLADIMLQSEHNNLDQNPYFSGPLITRSGHHLSRLGMPHTLQSIEAEIERDHSTMSELHQVDVRHIPYLEAQATIMRPVYNGQINAFRYPEEMLMQDRHRDMRLDVDHMSYEELLTLGEQIGSVRTGLREETITELLKRRDYECVIDNHPSSDPETCCICIQEYVRGEDIGALNCGHEFHTVCIKEWLVMKNKCPICMKKGLGT